MAVKFDTAVTKLIEIVEARSDFDELKRACVVRDLKGRVRLVIEAPGTYPVQELNQELSQGLDGWFNGPVLNASAGSAGERRLANTLLERGKKWPSNWPKSREGALGEIPIGEKWRGYQRLLSKQAWLDAEPGESPWLLSVPDPSIVAFYSFKGGVGRSTLVGIIAWQLANIGKKVVCLDLDLEAPGLGSLFDVTSEVPLIDVLLSHMATGRLPSEDPVQWINVHGEKIGVVPAGQVNSSYVEKLGRLDYLGSSAADDSPVATALKSLLRRIRGKHDPDYILLDCRTGLHDLGGLSLNDIAHLDLLVGRDTPQGRDGLKLILELLSKRRSSDRQLVQLVQTMIPLDSAVAERTRSRFRDAMYDASVETLYKDEEAPSVDNLDVAHYPWPVQLSDGISLAENLAGIPLSILSSREFSDIRSRVEALTASEDKEPSH